jgi:hypothetical protein
MVSDGVIMPLPLPHVRIITLVILKHLRYYRLLTCTHFRRYRCETNVMDKGCTNNSHVPEAAILTLDKDPTLPDTCEVARILDDVTFQLSSSTIFDMAEGREDQYTWNCFTWTRPEGQESLSHIPGK